MATPIFPPTATTNLFVNTLTTSKIVYLPAASTINSGNMFFIKDICGNAARSSIFISTTGLDTLENLTRASTLNAQINNNFQSVLLAPDGIINWMVLQNYITPIVPRFINPRPLLATFSYTGGDQTWRVPPFVNMVTIFMWGAGGGSVSDYSSGAGTPGGGGGYVTGLLPVNPGETLTLIVGQGPGNQSSQFGQGDFGFVYGGGGGGWGGGSSLNGGAPGGGRSAIRRSGTEIVTAGAGSGGYGSPGAGGGKQGLRGDGRALQTASGGLAGGGSSTIGGQGTTNGNYIGGSGTQFQGGGRQRDYVTSMGGGGWYGGGAAAAYGTGGGGSSYIDNLINGYTEAGSGSNPGGFSNPYRNFSNGLGTNTNTRFGHGLIVITLS